MQPWSDKETKLLTDKWHRMTKQELIDTFKGRSYKSIERKANSLNLKKSNQWKNNEVEILEKKRKRELREKYGGKDRLRGRPIRLNIVTLKPDRDNKDLGRYATLKFLGDIHWGSMGQRDGSNDTGLLFGKQYSRYFNGRPNRLWT